NLGRRVAVLGGMDFLPSASVNRFCASSLQATAMAAQAVKAGDGEAYLVGGVESTSHQPPHPAQAYPGSERAAARADELFESGATWRDPRDEGGTPYVDIAMGKTAEFVAGLTGTTRADQDE